MKAEPGYRLLASVLNDALSQAQNGKGKDRHAAGEPFEQQEICHNTRAVGFGYPLGQARKKAREAKRLFETKGKDAAIAECLGAINYLAAAVIVMGEQDHPERTAAEGVEETLRWRQGDKVLSTEALAEALRKLVAESEVTLEDDLDHTCTDEEPEHRVRPQWEIDGERKLTAAEREEGAEFPFYREFKKNIDQLIEQMEQGNIEVEKEENENLEYAHMNFCEAQARAKEDGVKELRISYDGNGEQLDRVVFNGEVYGLRGTATRIEVVCEPNERPVLRIEYVGREKG